MSLVALGMALIDAVKSGDRDGVESLLDAGADPNTTDLLEGLPALHYALSAGKADVARLLRARGAGPLEKPADDEPPASREELSRLVAAVAGPGADLAACLAPG